MGNINVKETMSEVAEAVTVSMPSHTVRLLAEYKELVQRKEKLEAILMKSEEGKLDFVLKCPQHLLFDQLQAMQHYEDILKKRMLCYEGITLPQLNAFMRG